MPALEVMDGRSVLQTLSEWPGDALLVLGTASCGACRRARAVLQALTVDQLEAWTCVWWKSTPCTWG